MKAVRRVSDGFECVVAPKFNNWANLKIMKSKLALFGTTVVMFIASTSLVWSQLTYPANLTNELTSQSLSASTTKCIVLIHGWNPENVADRYQYSDQLFYLLNVLKLKLNGTGWGLIAYHWEKDAATGSVWDNLLNFDFIPPTKAATNAQMHGDWLAQKLNTLSPNLREVQFVAHSAGSWAAREAAKQLLQLNPYVVIQITLLDPFVPYPNGSYGSDFSDEAMNGTQFFTGYDRIQRLENYYAVDSPLSWNPFGATLTDLNGPTYNTQETFLWRIGIDLNKQIDWGYLPLVTYREHYDYHSGPVEFYADTINSSIVGNPVQSGLEGLFCPFDYTQIGWNRSLYVWDLSFLPQIAVQPTNQSAQQGGSASFSVTANQAIDIAWYKVGGNWVGSGATLTLNNVSPSTAGSYVARLGNANGQIYSQAASLTVGAAAAPTTTSISPTSLPTSSTPQLITIYGTNFKPAGDQNASALIFRDPANNPYVRTPTNVTANSLQYYVNVQSATGTWSVIVTNAGQAASNPQTFNVFTPAANTGSLVVNLSPAGANSAGAQWLVNGTSYNSGDVIPSLAPGQYTVSFKSISGYTTPASFNVNVVANSQTTTNAAYTAVAATTYTLTLNQGGTGSINPAPTGTWNGSAYVYTAGSTVQLTANANTGYHFTGWSGDASGAGNPITITMSGNKNVTANFAAGDPNLGTVSVTILPQAAATAGVTWGWNSTDYRASGSSYTTWPGTYVLNLHTVDGWLGTPVIFATFVAGQTTNINVTFTPDTTPGLLTVALTPPDAVTAGAKWHVNGGAAQGNGATVSLPPGTNYSISFDSVPGWAAPANRTVAVARAQTTTVSGIYTPPAGQPAITSISPPIGPMTGGTLMTINGVNFTAPAIVLIGGQLATNVTVSSSTQLTCFTPASSTYGSTNIIVQTSGGNTTNLNGFAYGLSKGNKIDFVNSIGGSAYGVAVQGNYAYVGEGRNLLIVDISTPASPSKVGHVTLPGLIMSVALFGQYAYIADYEGGLQVVDISSPTTPKIRGFYATASEPWSTGISIFGGRAYVADENAGLQIFDLGNPTLPLLLSSTNCGTGEAVVVKAATNGVFAYLSTGGNLCVIDVSNPLSPILRGQTTINGGFANSLAVSGNFVFAAAISGNLEMINISNPDAPTSIGHAPGLSGPYAVATANNFVYAATWDGGSSFIKTFYTFSISGNSLVLAGQTTNTSVTGYNMVLSGNKAYIASGSSGLQVVDVSNPYNPSAVATFTDSGVFGQYDYPVAVTGNSLCAAILPSNNPLKIFDVSQPSQPTIAGQPNVSGSQTLARNGIAHVLLGNSNVVLNISNPNSPQILKTFSNTAIPGVKMAFVGNRLYVVGLSGASKPYFSAIDVSSPSSPIISGTKEFTQFSAGSLAISVAVNGNKALVGIQQYPGPSQVKILDISNISAPVEQGSLTNVGNPKDIQISASGNYAYVLEGSPSAIHVVDLSNPAIPVLVTNALLDSAGGTSLDMQGNELYATTYRGLYVFDLSNPASPKLSRSYTVISGVVGVTVPSDSANQSGYIYLADINGGIIVLKEQDIQEPNIFITNPTFSSVYTNLSSTMSLGGGSDDNVGVTAITWANNRGGSGNVNVPFDNWFASGITLLPGTNILTVTAFDAAGNNGSDALTVIYPTTNQNQTITFLSITNHTFGDAPIPLVAAASSGLPVAFSVVSGSASISNNVLTLTGAGAVTVEANQSGNNSFNPAPPVDVSFNVARANQSIAFAPISNHSAGDAPFALTATTSSGLPVYFNVISGPATTSSNMVTLLGGGSASVIAWQPGNSNYNAAATVQQSFTVSKIPQTITFGALSSQKAGDAPFPLTATTDSGLPVSFSAAGPATLSGNIVTLTGSGTVTVTASQPGNNTYAAASNVVQSFVVSPANNTLVGLGYQANGGFQLAFYGILSSNYSLLASSNLLNWQPITNFLNTNSPFPLRDANATNFNRRYYRTVMP